MPKSFRITLESIGSALYLGYLAYQGLREKVTVISLLGVGGMLLLAAKVFFFDLPHIGPLFSFILLSAIGLTMVAVSFFYQKKGAKSPPCVVEMAKIQ